MLQTLIDVTVASLLNVWMGVINFIPSLIGALIVLIIGLIVASGVRSLIEKVVNLLKIDNLLKKIGVDVYIERAGLRLNSEKFVGGLIYWFLIIVFILAVTDILELKGLSQFLNDVVSYIPNIIAAVLIMLATVVVANFARSLVKASVMSAKLHASNFLSALAWWAISIFGLLAVLMQLGVAPMLLNTVITGLIAMVAIAGGIAFGMGGKDYATHLINKLRERTE